MTSNTATGSPYAVELEHVSKSYPGTPPVEALSDVSISVPRSEFLGIIGASGSGKSTLLHVIGTLTRPSSGSVLIDGLDTAGMSDGALSGIRSQNVGFVFQDFFLLPGVSATENVGNGLLYSGTPARERKQRAEAMLERVGLDHRMNHLPNEMSGGEQQRVAIARALVHDPSFVLADEPTGNLDSQNTASLMELFVSLNDEGSTVILITHDPEVAEMCARQVTLRDGRIESDSSATP
ncbi:MAG: ABC transporter ATP-binding protein [SAR202 cluster bacterium]|jgi:putative ABC transport system ATP-binding protein|nr:ABC transporter ATP-binding protein [SAR202 cluster bacterium]MDP6714153.1 ABC transporter ATP-binding protein [SAR202 cluster bacterium]